jgi:hypothetical protein
MVVEESIVLKEAKRKLRGYLSFHSPKFRCHPSYCSSSLSSLFYLDIVAFEDLSKLTIANLNDRLSKELDTDLKPHVKELREYINFQLLELAKLELAGEDVKLPSAPKSKKKETAGSARGKKRGDTEKAKNDSKKRKAGKELKENKKKKKKTSEGGAEDKPKKNPFSNPLLLSEPLKAIVKTDKVG